MYLETSTTNPARRRARWYAPRLRSPLPCLLALGGLMAVLCAPTGALAGEEEGILPSRARTIQRESLRGIQNYVLEAVVAPDSSYHRRALLRMDLTARERDLPTRTREVGEELPETTARARLVVTVQRTKPGDPESPLLVHAELQIYQLGMLARSPDTRFWTITWTQGDGTPPTDREGLNQAIETVANRLTAALAAAHAAANAQ